MEQKNLKLAVKNFGPIREGEVEFKPLTVFIGPNNSGKSYMAVLLYSLLQELAGKKRFPYLLGFPPFDFSIEDMEALAKWSRSVFDPSNENNDPPIRQIHPVLQNYFDSEIRELKSGVPNAIREYFGSWNLNELIYDRMTDFSIALYDGESSTPFISVREGYEYSSIDVEIEKKTFSPDDAQAIRALGTATQEPYSPSIPLFLMRSLWESQLLYRGAPKGDSRYLPAGRSGLVQGWQMIASLAVGTIGQRIGAQGFVVPSFQGVARDFTQQLLSLMSPIQRNEKAAEPAHAVDLLENKTLHGRVHVQMDNYLPAMEYESGGLRLPIQRASSMVAELAPIYLWMKRLLKSGDVLIIDEPEAHLHPENQRLIAQVLVRLMNAGVRVVCTTHSSLILHQLSNHILATSSGKLEKVGFAEHDKLDLEDIGVYLFELAEDGSQIKEVEVDSDFGISEDEFVRVAEQIGDETYQLVT